MQGLQKCGEVIHAYLLTRVPVEGHAKADKEVLVDWVESLPPSEAP